MRLVICGSRLTSYGALAFVSLVAAWGCAQTSTNPAAVEPAGLSEAKIAALIEGHVDFGRPITVEVMSAVVSPTVRSLANDGYLSLEDQGPVRAALTDKGRKNGFVEVIFEYGRPYYTVPVARRELVEVSSVEDWPRKAPAKRIAFTYRRSPLDAGRDLLDAGSGLAELQTDRLYVGNATLVLDSEGWIIQSLKL